MYSVYYILVLSYNYTLKNVWCSVDMIEYFIHFRFEIFSKIYSFSLRTTSWLTYCRHGVKLNPINQIKILEFNPSPLGSVTLTPVAEPLAEGLSSPIL